MIDLTEVLTQQAFGELVGITQPAVYGLIVRGVLAKDSTGSAWLKSYCSHLREQAAGRATTSDLELVTERAKLANEQAQRVAMQNAKARGELVEAEKVKSAAVSLAAMTRNALERIPDVIADRLAAESNSAACHALLAREIDLALVDLSNACRNFKA